MKNKCHLVIAGTSRSGKTSLALELELLGFQHYKMDSIKRAIGKQFCLDQHDWKYFSSLMSKMMRQMIEENSSDTGYGREYYLLDVLHLLPKDSLSFSNTIVVFLGYAHTTPEAKLEEVRKNDQEYYWSNQYSDKQLLEIFHYNILYSQYLEKECTHLGIPYFDTSLNRNIVLNEIKNWLLEKMK